MLWDGDSETIKSHITHLAKLVKEANPVMPMVAALVNKKIEVIELEVKMEDVRRQIEGWFKSSPSLACILPVLEVNARLQGITNDDPVNWPKGFLQAMMKEDWREWVSAVKKEIESWHLFDVAKVVAFEDMMKGATIIPLGELFTRERCGK